MSPWGFIGWLLAGLLALAITIGLFFLSRFLGWTPWVAPLLLWVPLLIYGMMRLLFWFLARSGPPRIAVLDPSNPFTGQWEAIKSGLPGQNLALYLVIGDDDEAKRSLLSRSLGQAEYQAAPSGPEGLSLWAADGRAWLSVPATLWTDRVDADDLTAGMDGDWGHLMKLLPGFPGSLSGLVVMLDPEKLKADAEELGQRLSRKLTSLASTGGNDLPWWLVLHPLEKLPEGRRLEEALRCWPTAGSDLWDRPFGLETPAEDRRSPELAVLLGNSLQDLSVMLDEYLRRADSSPLPPPLSKEVLSLTEALTELPLGLMASGLEGGRKLRLDCRGLYLTMLSADGPGQFSRMLFQHLIPERPLSGRGYGTPFFRRVILICSSAIAALLLGLMVYGHERGGQAIGLAGQLNPLMEQIKKPPTDNIPPIASLALSTDLVLKIDQLSKGPATFYRAPALAAERGREDLAEQLHRWLPADNSPVFTLALADWAGRGLAPLTFPVPQNSSAVLIPSFAGSQGRGLSSELTAKWTHIIGGTGASLPQTVQAGYDRLSLQSWRRAAEELDLALTISPDNLRLAAENGFDGLSVGPQFLETAGRELAFLRWRDSPHWVRLAKEVSLVRSWAGVGDFQKNSDKLSSFWKRLNRPDNPLGPDGVDKLMKAGQAWKDYEESLVSLTPLARSPKGLAKLAEEMFAGHPSPPERLSLFALHYSSLEALEGLENLAGHQSGEDREMVARLFLSPVKWLIQGSVAAAALSLEDEWNRKVLLPAKDLSGVERAELLLGETGAVAAFREGLARPYLVATPKGFRPAEALGQPFPWSRNFMKFINASQEPWRKSAGGLRGLKVSALLRPVRATGVMVINHPLGVRLDMVCQADPFKAEAFNRPVTFKAEWSPQECGPLSVTVIFRDFTLTRDYIGLAGFNEFIKAAAKGEILLSAEDFPDRVHLLKASGVETVILGIDLERGPELVKTLNTPLPKLVPPSRIIAGDSSR